MYMYVYVHVCGVCELVCTCMWRSEDNKQEPILSSHPVGCRDGTQVISLGGKCLYPLSPFTRSGGGGVSFKTKSDFEVS